MSTKISIILEYQKVIKRFSNSSGPKKVAEKISKSLGEKIPKPSMPQSPVNMKNYSLGQQKLLTDSKSTKTTTTNTFSLGLEKKKFLPLEQEKKPDTIGENPKTQDLTND